MNFLKKNWYLAIPAVLLLSPLIIIIGISINYGYTFPESVAVMKAFGKAQTKYQSMQFSEEKFNRIVPGTWGKDVFALVGMPLERHDNDTRWAYTQPLGGAQYWHERTLVLNKGQVTHIIRRFHSPESK